MKKNKILIVFVMLFCLFTTTKVSADVRDCDPFDSSDAKKNLTGVKVHFEHKKAYSIGEKVYLDISGKEMDNNDEVEVLLRTVGASETKFYSAYLKNIIGNDQIGAYFIIPDDPIHMPVNNQFEIYGYRYYRKTNEIKEYGITPEGEKTPIYKTLCSTYYTKKEDANNDDKSLLLDNSYITFTTSARREDVRDILVNVSSEKNYTYFGGKVTFKVTTTEPVKSAYLTFVDRTKKTANLTFFTVNLLSDGKSNEFTYTVNAPSYGINNVYEGKYKLEEIMLFDMNDNKLTYNTNIEKAEEYHSKYKELDYTLYIGKSVTDLIKESNFELKNVKLTKNEAKVGDKLNVDFDFYYNSPMLEIQSVLLTFSDEQTGEVFSTYLKSFSRDSSIIIPSNTKEKEYTLKAVTITFNSYVGETNTIILDNSVLNENKDIFNQKLKIVENKDAGLYFIAEELYETSYDIIKKAKENAIITINADGKSTLPSELFDAIKETSKQLVIQYDKNEWVFSGVDIEKSKPIDVSMNFYDANKLVEENIKTVVGDKAVVLEFPQNGNLPGKALIRIKNEEVFNKLTGDVYYVYHIDDIENKLNKVAVEIQKSTDGYLEFYINHNSKYVITNEEINDNEVVSKDDSIAKVNTVAETAKKDTKENEKNNNTVYIIFGVMALIIIVLVVVVIKMNNKLSKKNNNIEKPLQKKE